MSVFSSIKFRSSGLLEKLEQLLSAEDLGLKSYSNFSMMPKLIPLYFIIYLFIILKLTLLYVVCLAATSIGMIVRINKIATYFEMWLHLLEPPWLFCSLFFLYG
jgi:hypothetical protein